MANDAQEEPVRTEDNTMVAQDEDITRRRRRKPKHDFPQTQAGKLWDAFGNPEEPINTMPGGTFNTAGGRPGEYSWKDAFTFTKSDFENFYKKGCARDALLVGIAGGGTVGGLTFIVKGIFSNLIALI